MDVVVRPGMYLAIAPDGNVALSIDRSDVLTHWRIVWSLDFEE